MFLLFRVSAAPVWGRFGYSRSWGYRPTGGIGVLLLIILVLWLLGVFR